ncbi:hypothetical protein PAXINDRAFT_83477, partial [Paxillus involutus ATCC 200175]
GNDLPPDSDPPPQGVHQGNPWHPFIHQSQYHLAEFLFCRNETPQDHIDDLMDIWASMPGSNDSPPFANYANLIVRLMLSEVTLAGSVFQSSMQMQILYPSIPSWKRVAYDLWFQNPESLAYYQLSMPDFKDHIDFAPCQVFGDNHQRIWSDLMMGNWAWRQCVSVYLYNEIHIT